jgi:outer membrane protein, multidrug efflux system
MNIRLAALGALFILLQACAITHVSELPKISAPLKWADGGDLRVERGWWASFGDPVLTGLIDEALLHNLDLRVALSRIAEARALGNAQRSSVLPSLDANFGGQRSRSISEIRGQPYLSTGSEPQFVAAYEIDLWGRIAALNEAASANYEASHATHDAAALSVTASVAIGYINLRSIDAQLDLAQRTMKSRERSLELTRVRYKSGYGAALESAQAEAELRATAQVIPQLELAAVRQEQMLNILLARPSGTIVRGLALSALNLRELPATGLPSDLLRRRPDISIAELQVVAADAQLDAARAQLLPSVRLSASIGSVSASVLHGDPFTVWNMGGSVLAPIFNGGRLRALAEASASRRDQALIGYERTVLTAFAEVETQLTAFAKLQEQAVQAEAQRAAVAESLRIAGNRYREGYSSYLEVLLAQRNLFTVEQSLMQQRSELLSAAVSVYKALGGGWESPRLHVNRQGVSPHVISHVSEQSAAENQ